MTDKIKLLNVDVNNLSMQETIALVDIAISNNKQIHYADLNADKIVTLQTDKELQDIYKDSTIVNADGQSVIWASKIMGMPLKERVPGIDLMGNLIELAHQKNYKVYLLGAKEEVVSKLVEIYESKYGNNLIAGFRNGYFTEVDEQKIVSDIVASNAQLLFVAITSPKKEQFLFRHKTQLSTVNFIMGVGGSFDVFAGKVKRAPVWMQKIGMEWFFRLIQEPKRMWKRYLTGNTKFILLLLREKFTK